MPDPTPIPTVAAIEPACTHAQAGALLRRPFAPGAVGFRAMSKVPFNGDPYGGANVAAFIGAQSIMQRLNAVVPGRWKKKFHSVPPELIVDSKKLYLACRLTITLPQEDDGFDDPTAYEDIGEMDRGSFAGLKQLYSDALKRAAANAGMGTYLYTALAPVVLPIGNGFGEVQVIRRGSGKDQLVLSPATEQWLREGYAMRMHTDVVRRDLGEVLSHGEPEIGMGQGEVGEHTDSEPVRTPDAAAPSARIADSQAKGENGSVSVDFDAVGPAAQA